jgi:hypothetical protein
MQELKADYSVSRCLWQAQLASRDMPIGQLSSEPLVQDGCWSTDAVAAWLASACQLLQWQHWQWQASAPCV